MPKGTTTKVCQRCSNEFIGGIKRLYCSDCETVIYYTCSDCGKPKSYKYSKWCYPCSLKHRDTSKSSKNIKIAIEAAKSIESRQRRSKSLSGPNHPNWQGSISITEQIKAEVKKRDNHECQDCGEEEKLLDIHHKDRDRSNNNLDNLITLCRSCHKIRHHKEDK